MDYSGTRFQSRAAFCSLIALSCLCALLLAAVPASAQGNDPESPPRPALVVPPVPPLQSRLFFGLFGGMELPMGSGEFSLTCDLCKFTSPSGLGGGGGLLAEYALNERWSLGVRLGYSTAVPVYTIEISDYRFLLSGEKVTATIERRAAFKLSAATALVAARWHPGLGGFYAIAGPQLRLIVSNNVKETERMTTVGQLYMTTGTDQLTLYDGEIGGVINFRKAQLGVRGGLGYDLPLSERVVIAPEVSYLFPIIGMSSTYKAWKLGSLDGTIVASIKF